jgi:hypothetical protein
MTNAEGIPKPESPNEGPMPKLVVGPFEIGEPGRPRPGPGRGRLGSPNINPMDNFQPTMDNLISAAMKGLQPAGTR